jgi:hypothetical protein
MDHPFLNQSNLNILQEILFEELKINKNSQWTPQIKQIFINNVDFFLKNTNMNNSLIELNKLFLKQVMLAINKLIPNLKNNNQSQNNQNNQNQNNQNQNNQNQNNQNQNNQNQNNQNQNKKINIISNDIHFPHKIEDIQNIKLDLFNEEFNMKKQEFDTMMKHNAPNNVNFSDNYTDNKITDMEQLLTEKISQRNSEIPLIEELIEIPITQTTQTPSKNKKVNFSDELSEIKKTQYDVQTSTKLPINENENFYKCMEKMETIDKNINKLIALVEQLSQNYHQGDSIDA